MTCAKKKCTIFGKKRTQKRGRRVAIRCRGDREKKAALLPTRKKEKKPGGDSIDAMTPEGGKSAASPAAQGGEDVKEMSGRFRSWGREKQDAFDCEGEEARDGGGSRVRSHEPGRGRCSLSLGRKRKREIKLRTEGSGKRELDFLFKPSRGRRGRGEQLG